MKTRVLTLLTTTVVAVCIVSPNLRGQGTVYTSRSLFEAALSSSTTITFESVPPTLPSVPSPTGLSNVTASGVTFSAEAFLYVTDPDPQYYHPIPGTGRYLWHFDGGVPVGIEVPNGITGFGADLSGGVEPNAAYNATVTVNLVGGQSYEYPFTGPRGSWTFFGATFGQPIANIVYDDGGSDFPGLHEEMIDNFTFGSVIPEPRVLGLVGLGALVLGWRRQRHSTGVKESKDTEC